MGSVGISTRPVQSRAQPARSTFMAFDACGNNLHVSSTDPKTVRDLLATGVNECRVLADVMAAAAAKATPPLPAAGAAILAMKPSDGAA